MKSKVRAETGLYSSAADALQADNQPTPEVLGVQPTSPVPPTPVEPGLKRIRLRYNYRGEPSKERVIVAGDYKADDPALFGLAKYLLKNGHAVEVIEE